jgi:peptide/nickel transport system substrate-binding protein
MKRNLLYTITAALVLLSMVLGACAQPPAAPATTEAPAATEAPAETEAPEATEEMTEEAPAETEAAPEETEAATEEAAAGEKVFIFGRGGDTVGMDLAVVTDGESTRTAGQILEPLYSFADGTTVPEPALAEECTPNEDTTVWTCTLRQGVKFHDGTDFNADAVIFNFDRWRFTDNPHHYESQVFEYYEAMWGGFDDASIITSVEKTDDYTVVFNLSTPLAPFLANLSMDFFSISSPAAIEANGENYGTPSVGAVGTGPFKFVEWVEGDHITVEANEDYWGGRPKLDQIIWRVIPDDSARFLALQAGDIHGLEQATSEDLATAGSDPNLQVVTRPPLNTAYLAFNYKIQEFQDPKVREAVAHAINKEGLVANFYGEYGQVAKTLIPSSMWGYNDAVEDFAYDPDLSRQLLTEAGFPDGLSEVTIAEDVTDADGNVVFAAGDKMPLRFYYMPVTRFYYPSPKEIGEAMAADLANAGINVELYLEGDWPTYLASRAEGRLMGLYMLGWGGDNGDPDNFLGYFWGSGSEPIAREGWYQNPEVAELLQTAASTAGQENREPLYMQAEQMLHDDIARVYIAHNATPIILLATVSGYQTQAVDADNYENIEIAE